MQQLEVDNFAALGPALARCKATPGAVATLDLEVAEDGHVGAGKPFGAVADKSLVRCVEQQLRRAAFTCTDDGKPAKLRLLVEWPAKP